MEDICDLCALPADPSVEECWRVDCRAHCSDSGIGDVYHAECVLRFIKAQSGLQYVNFKTATHGAAWPCPRGKGKGPGVLCKSWVQNANILVKKKPKAPKTPAAPQAAAPRNKQQPANGKAKQPGPNRQGAAGHHPAKAAGGAAAARQGQHLQQQQQPVARRPPLPATPKADPLGRKLPGATAQAGEEQEDRALPPGYDPEADVPANRNARKRAKAAAAKAAAAAAVAAGQTADMAGSAASGSRLTQQQLGPSSSAGEGGASGGASTCSGPSGFGEGGGLRLTIDEQHRALMGGGNFITDPKTLAALLGGMGMLSDEEEEEGGQEQAQEQQQANMEEEEEESDDEWEAFKMHLMQQQQQQLLTEQVEGVQPGAEWLGSGLSAGFQAPQPGPGGHVSSGEVTNAPQEMPAKAAVPAAALCVPAGGWDPAAAASLGPDTPAAREGQHTAAAAAAAAAAAPSGGSWGAAGGGVGVQQQHAPLGASSTPDSFGSTAGGAAVAPWTAAAPATDGACVEGSGRSDGEHLITQQGLQQQQYQHTYNHHHHHQLQLQHQQRLADGAPATYPPPPGFPQVSTAAGHAASPASLPPHPSYPHGLPPHLCVVLPAVPSMLPPLGTPPTPMQGPPWTFGPGSSSFSSSSGGGSGQVMQGQEIGRQLLGLLVQQQAGRGVGGTSTSLPDLPSLLRANAPQQQQQQAQPAHPHGQQHPPQHQVPGYAAQATWLYAPLAPSSAHVPPHPLQHTTPHMSMPAAAAQADTAAGVVAQMEHGGGWAPAALLPAVPTVGAHKHMYAHHGAGGSGSNDSRGWGGSGGGGGDGGGGGGGIPGPAVSHQGPGGEEDEEGEALVEELMLMLT